MRAQQQTAETRTSLFRSLWCRSALPGRSASVKRLFALARPYRGLLIAGLVTAVAGGLVGLASPMTWRYLVDAIVPGGPAGQLGRVTLILIGLYVAGGALGVLSGYLLSLVGLRLMMDLRLMLYEHLQTLSMGFFNNRRVGELVSRVMNDVRAVRTILTDDLAGLLQQAIYFFGALVLILVTDWRLTAFMLLMVPAVSLISLTLGRAIRRLSLEAADGAAAVTTVLEESLSGLRTVRSFGREPYETGRLRGRLSHLLALAVRQMYLEVVFGPMLGMLFFSTTVLTIWFGGREVLAGRLTVGQLVTFIILTSVLGSSIRWVGGFWTRLQATLGTCDRVFELLDLPPELSDSAGAIPLPPVEGRLTFENVSFSYADWETGASSPPVLEKIWLDVLPGERVAIIGPSGAGKTTIIHLVTRLYEPTGGRILLDGIDVRAVTLKSLRDQIGLVPQETQLFCGSVRENILYGRLDATEAELIEASRAANAHEFIVRLPQGYDTVVGEWGAKLSGGQRQRIAIARALLKNPRLLLLDEATSALDNESEELVQEALDRLMKGRTTLVVAHRLSTIKNADRIAVLDSQRLVELGTHEELLARNGLYARLYRYQFKEPAPSPAWTV